jgi:hypothetical protein
MSTEDQEEVEMAEEKASAKVKGGPGSLKEVLEKAETLGKTLSEALQNRANVVMVRVNDDTLHYLDMLVEAGVCKSRSESAAFLIGEGVKSSHELFDKIEGVTAQIASLRAQLRDIVRLES